MIRIIDHEGNGYGAQAEITRKKGVNGEKSLTGTIYTNDKVLNGVDRGWKLEFENELYAFIFALPKDTGNQIELEFDAVHEFFYDMSKNSQNNLLSDGSHTFKTYLDFIFNGTGYNYRSDVDVKAFEKQNFGQRNRLDLFYDVIDTAGVEFSVNGSVVRIIERVGNDLSTVVKKGFNLNELRLEKNIGNFVTYQKGFGAWNDDEDHSKGRLEVEYLSPLAEIYGKLDADPVVDERYTVKSNLENRLKSNVEGSYQISVQIDMEDLTRAGYEYKQPHEGDSIMAINKDLGFQRKVRIVSYETDFDVEGNILDHRITCNSVGMVEESILSNNSIKNSIKELQTDLELTRKQVIEFNISADGKSTNYYGPIEPSPDEYKLRIGDTWFDSSGEDTIVKVWNGVEWRKSGADVDAIRREVEQAQADIAQVQQTADEAVNRINGEIAGKFTDIDTEISQVHNDAQNALNQAGDAVSQVAHFGETLDGFNQTVVNIDGRVTNIRHDVDGITETVTDHTGKIATIERNVNGIQQTVSDPVNGLVTQVSTLANGFNVLATDFENMEIGGRNLLINSTFKGGRNGWATQAGDVEYVDDLMISSGSPAEIYRNNVLDGLDSATVSVWVKGSGRFQARAGGGVRPGYTSFNHNDFKQVSTTFKDMGNGNLILMFDGDNIEVERVKLEKGNKATDWTPAPEDMATQAQLSVLNDNINLRVEKGDVLGQINIEAGTTLIQNDKLLLDAQTVVFSGQAFIPGAVIEDLSVDGAKIADATINSAKINDLDVNKISGNTTSFVSSAWNSNNASVFIDPYGVHSVSGLDTVTLRDGALWLDSNSMDYPTSVLLDGVGLRFATNNKTARMRFNGENLVLDNSLGLYGNHINSVNWLRLIGDGDYETVIHKHPTASGGAIVDSSMLTLGLGTRNSFSSIAQFYGQIDFRRNLHLLGNDIRSVNRVALENSNTHILSHHREAGGVLVDSTRFTVGIGSITTGFNDRLIVTNSQVAIDAHLNMRARRVEQVARLSLSDSSTHLMSLSTGGLLVDGARITIGTGSPSTMDPVARFFGQIHFYKNVYLNGNSIIEGSDERIKENIVDRTEDDLATIMAIDYKNFDMINGNKNQRGFIAQQLQLIDSDLITENNGQLGYNSSNYVHTIGHAVQQLASRELNTNKVASQALQLAEDTNVIAINNKSEIESLKQENKELRNEIQKLKEAA